MSFSRTTFFFSLFSFKKKTLDSHLAFPFFPPLSSSRRGGPSGVVPSHYQLLLVPLRVDRGSQGRSRYVLGQIYEHGTGTALWGG